MNRNFARIFYFIYVDFLLAGGFLIISGIQAEPLMAPSYAQVAQREKRDDPAVLKDAFMSSVKELLKNSGYVLLLISYGINVGAFFAISTLLNQFILLYFPVSKRTRADNE